MEGRRDDLGDCEWDGRVVWPPGLALPEPASSCSGSIAATPLSPLEDVNDGGGRGQLYGMADDCEWDGRVVWRTIVSETGG